MDILELLKRSIDALPEGSHRRGLIAVLRHIEVAARYLTRASEINEDDLYTDVVYRTNQAFEGSIKEAFRVLSGEDPEKTSIFNIEEYLKGDNVLRDRVLTQFSRYRKEWRNPATHDYTLDFDQDEAFLALISVSAFAKVLVDQIGQKLAEKQAAGRVGESKRLPQDSLHSFLGIEAAYLLNALANEDDSPRTESELIGTLVGFLGYPELEFDLDAKAGDGQRRADLIVRRETETTVVEAKSSNRPSELQLRYEAQMVSLMESYDEVSGLLILWHPEGEDYEFHHWPPGREYSEKLGVVLFKKLKKPDASLEPTLGDILGQAFRKET